MPIPHALFIITGIRPVPGSQTRDDSYVSERHANIWAHDQGRAGGGGKKEVSSRFIFVFRAFSVPRTQLSQSMEQAIAKRTTTPNIKRSYYTTWCFILNRTHFCVAGLTQCFMAAFFFFFFFMLLYAITLRVIYINTDQLLTGFYYDKPGSPPPPLFFFYFLARSTRFVIKSNVICKNNRICNKNQLNMQ